MRFVKSILLFTFPFTQLIAQPSSNYFERNSFALTSPGAMKYGLYGYDNPALLSALKKFDLYFTWSDAEGDWSDFKNYGVFAAVPNFGFSIVRSNWKDFTVTDYKISTGFGSPELSFGIGYGWSTGRTRLFDRSDLFTLGTLFRPNAYLSLGVIGNFFSKGEQEAIFDLGVRPLGNELITLFGDYYLKKDLPENISKWSTGIALEAFPGIRLIGRYFDNKTMTLGIQLSFGSIGLSSQAYFDKDNKRLYNSYGIRAGAYDRNLFTELFPKKKYVDMDLKGPLKYRKFKLFDNSNTLQNLLQQIEAAKLDQGVAGIAINTSGMTANREMLWEVREKLKEFKSAGKKVVVYIDRAEIDQYHFASVADKIVIDPLGMIMLQGYLMGRPFFKGTFEKLGIGIDELRFFKYKSAVETYSRDKMSEADAEQRQKLIDDYYKLAQTDVFNERGISLDRFDQIVNDEMVFLADEAVSKGLADTIGRWDMVKDIIKELEGEERSFAAASSLEKFKLPNDNRWGKKPQIAIIYALGACAMDDGIKARSLVKDCEKAVDDPNIKAIVLRVDSPGGDGLASDLIAEALKKAKGKKPVIVSQGYIAGSGGYWLSMYGDTIVAAPTTITGSIGVILFWYYDKSLKEKLGVTTDFVKKGKHADLGFGFVFPLIGVALPDRGLTTEERGKFEQIMKTMYKEFIGKVASGRNKSSEAIEKVAEGRVWSGYDGIQLGLVDVLGGLETAVNIAKEKVGLKDKEVEIIELPEMPWIDLSMFTPKIFGFDVNEDETIKNLKFRLKNNGVPMPLMPLEVYESQLSY